MKQVFEKQGKDSGRRFSRLLPWLLGLSVMLAGSPLAAAEVYTWTDADGVLHFSDTPRPDGQSETIEAEEAYRPGTADAYPAPAAPSSSEQEPPEVQALTESDEPPPSAAEAQREERARQREERRAAQAEQDRLCEQHRQRLEQVEPSRRVFYTDASGETVRLDDEERVRLVEESRAFIDENCQD